MIFAPSGWGKSRLLGRRICYQDTMRGTGQVVIDRVGGTIDNLLDKILYLPRETQVEVGKRIVYCNMAGERDLVTLWPMLQRRQETESLYHTAERVVKLLSQIDENFANATIQGLMRSAPLLRSVCQVLITLDLPISMADPILVNPKAHVHLFEEAQRRNPQSTEAARDLISYANLEKRRQGEWSEPLRNRLSILKHDQASRAMFTTKRSPLINWEKVAERGQTVLIDLRGEVSDFALAFKLFWVWNSILEYIQSRGAKGHSLPPLSVIIDELSFFVQGTNFNTKEIVKDFREIVFARKRNANIYICAATQEQRELPKNLLTACMSLGSLLLGATVDKDTALTLAERFDHLDTKKIKNTEYHFGRELKEPAKPWWGTQPVLSGESKTFYTLAELGYIESQKYLDLPKEDWFMAQALYEGHVPRRLKRVTTRNLDPGQWVNGELVAKLRTRLMTRDGVKVSEVIKEIEETEEMPGTLPEEIEQPGQTTASKPRRTGRRRFVEG